MEFFISIYKKLWLPLLTLLIGAVLSVSAFLMTSQEQARLQDASFIANSDKSIEYLRVNLQANTVSLNTLKTFYDVSENMDRAKFGRFVTPLLSDNPSIMVYGWLPKVLQSERGSFEAQLSQDYNIAAPIRDGDGVGGFSLSVQKPDYYPVAYGIPNKIAQSRLGVDMASVPQGGPAIDTAIRSGEMTASGPIPATGEFGLNSNIMIFKAVYNNDPPLAKPDDSGAQDVTGVVMALFKVGDLIEKQFNAAEDIVFYIEDITDPNAARPIYGKPPTLYKSRREESFLFAQRKWSITSATNHKTQPFQWLPFSILAVGLIFSLFVSRALYSLIHRKELVENTVSQRTHELNRTVEKLADSNEDLARFAYICSHDLQAPLRHIKTMSTLLEEHFEEELKKDEDGRRYLSIIKDGAENARQLIVDILAYSSADSDTKKSETFNAETIVDNLRETLSVNLDESGGQITRGALPALRGNKTQFYQLLQNLIKNGLKYQAEDTTPHVHISVEDKDTHWQFAVSDNGIGIAEKYRERVFEVFKRLHRRQEYAGTGVGLAICKKIVERHGGSIWVTSNPEQGSIFYFTFPKNDA